MYSRWVRIGFAVGGTSYNWIRAAVDWLSVKRTPLWRTFLAGGVLVHVCEMKDISSPSWTVRNIQRCIGRGGGSFHVQWFSKTFFHEVLM